MSFKHFYKVTFTESEVKIILETLNESRWWGKFKEEASIVEYETEDNKMRKFKAWKMQEDGGPTYVVEARKGLRYGLYRTTEGKFICARLKPGKKNIIKPKGIFQEVDGKLVFELFKLPTIIGKNEKVNELVHPHPDGLEVPTDAVELTGIVAQKRSLLKHLKHLKKIRQDKLQNASKGVQRDAQA